MISLDGKPPHDSVRRTPARTWGKAVPWGKWARRSAEAAVAVTVVYLAAMNVFLGTRLFRGAVSYDPNHFRVEYARAYSLFPGRIHVEGLSIRGQDGSIQWILNLDRCDFTVSFFDLTRRKFHASHVRGRGLSFRVRLRVDHTTTPEHLAELPPVPGFTDPPWQDSAPPVAPPTDGNYKLWGVQLDDVDADPVRELWIDTLRYSGNLRVRGRWLFHPIRWLDVGPAVIDARSLDISYGMHPLATDLHGVIDATVHPFDVRIPKGAEILDFVSVRAALHGRLRAAETLQTLAPPGLSFGRGEGPLDVDLRVDHGTLAPPTHVVTTADPLQGSDSGTGVSGSVTATLDVEGGAGKTATAVATAKASGVDARGPDGAAAHASAVSIALRSQELNLSRPFGDATFHVGVDGAETQSLEPWVSRVHDWSAKSGPAALSGFVEGGIADERAGGHVNFTATNFSVKHGAVAGSADVDVDVSFQDASLRDKSVSIQACRVSLRNASAQKGDASVGARSLDVEGSARTSVEKKTLGGHVTIDAKDMVLRRGSIHAAAALSARIEGDGSWGESTLALAASDIVIRDVHIQRGGGQISVPHASLSTSGLSLAPSGLGGHVLVDVPYVQVPDVEPLAHEEFVPKDVVIGGGSASAAMKLDVDLPTRTATGTVNLSVRDLDAHLASKMLRGNLDLGIVARARGNATELSASSLAFDSRPASPGDGNAKDDYWARAELSASEFRLDPTFLFRSHIHFTASDSSPISALVASRTPIPRWLLAAVPFEGLEATGDLALGPSSLNVRSFAAHGGADRANLEYTQRGDKVEWALLVEAGNLGTSFHVQDGHMQFVIAGARSWYDGKVSLVRASSAP